MAQTKVSLIKDQVIDLSHFKPEHGITTDHIGEGSTRQYFTESRVQNILTTNNYIKTSDVANLETVTSLSINANVLSYTNEAGVTTNIDLSVYLDDSNLARIVSGSLNSGTGVATFTRDDSSTFTVDFSAFLSDANDYVTSASFNTTSGVLTLTRLGGGTVTVDLDGKYSVLGHTHSWTEITSRPTALSAFTNDSGYLTSETDPTVPAHVKSITSINISNWNTAYTYSQVGHLPLAGGTLTGTLNGLGANFTDPVTIYDNSSSENPRLSVGRGATERLSFDVEDRVAKIYHVQDETSGGHSMEFSINSADPSKTFYWLGKAADATSPVTFMTLNSSGITATGYNNANWDTAYGWGNHASAGYLTSLPSHTHDYVPERSRTDWNDNTVINDVIGQLAWKNYGNNHTIFDASAGTSPSGTSVNNTNSTYAWSATYPTLMGWNGAHTYGVRVDSSRVSDSTNSVSWSNISGKPSTFAPSAHNHDDRYYTESESDVRFAPISHSHPYLSDNSDSEQTIGSKVNYFNVGGLRMNMDPRWNEGGYDGDNGNLHIWSTRADGGNYGRAGIALYNGSAYQYLTTKGSQNALYHNNNEIITSATIGSQSVSYSNSTGSVAWSNVSGKPSTFAPSSHDHDRAFITDTRGAVRAPSYYDDRYVQWDFQNTADTGAAGDGWHVLQTISPWSVYNNSHRQQQLVFTGTGGIKFRYASSESEWTGWQTLWTSGNDGSGSGLDADLLDGQQPSTTGGGNKIAQYASNGYLYVNNWIHPADNAGLFWDNGVHVKATTSGELELSDSGQDVRFAINADVNKWKYVRLRTGTTTKWDIATNESNRSGALQFRVNGGDNGAYIDTSANMYSTASFRAPIFYDSNDTNLYVDPAGTSVLNYVTATEYKFRSSTNNARFNGVSDWGTRLYTDGGYIQFGPANTGHAHIYTDRANFYFNKQLTVNGGSQINSGDIRAGVLYDINDTNIRLDGGTLVLRGDSPTIYFRDTNHTSAMWHVNSHLMYLLRGNGDTESWSQVNGQWPVYWDLGNNNAYFGGTVLAVNAVTAPIFYDRDNTGYYLNPAGTSNLYDLQLSGAKHTYLYITPGNGYEAMVRFNGGSGSTWYIGSRTSTQLIGSTDAYHVYSQTAGRTVGGYDTGGNHYAYNSSRAPIFYDSNNTAYYVNPASGSYLSGANSINVAPESGVGLKIQGGSNGGHALVLNGGGYSSAGEVTFPNYATGISMINTGSFAQNAFNFNYGTGVSSNVGSIRINSTSTSYITSSDYRLKENLVEITDGIDRLKLLKPKRFNFIGHEEVVDGFVAHEAQEVVPESVTGEKDAIGWDGNPEYQGIDQSKLVPLLTAAIQEAVAKIESLESRIQALEEK